MLFTVEKVKRSYGQYCALAKALDVVGQRWTLLIVRELIGGPRRFRDLMDGLPGIGTNLLSERLRELQEAEVIQKRTLPPPAGSTIYELTERGAALVPAAAELARWGFELMEPPGADEEFRVHWIMTFGCTAFRPERAVDTRLTCEMRTGETDVAHFRVEDGELRVFHGPADDPDLSLSGTPRALIDLLAGSVPPEKAVKDGVELDGDLSTLRRMLRMFGPPRRSTAAR
jgi:DNA-binding HxlR family transcriptional regulator